MKQIIPLIAKIASVCLLLITIASHSPLAKFRLIELCSHFPLQCMGIAIILVLILARKQHRGWPIVAFTAMMINLPIAGVWYMSPDLKVPEQNSANLRILLSNVHTSNRQFEKLIDLIEQEDPDVIALVEVDAEWIDALTKLHKTYPHRIEIPRPDNFGIAVFSRLALIRTNELALGATKSPAIEVKLQSEGRELTLVAAHTLPPLQSKYFEIRNNQLEELANHLNRLTGPRVLIGDLNVTMWSPFFAQFEDVAELQNARLGYGVLPTWPAGNRLMMIPIDHCLYSEEVSIRDLRVGNNIASDHLPLIVDVSF